MPGAVSSGVALLERMRRNLAGRVAERRQPHPRAGDEFRAALFFSGTPGQVYQARQWLWPLEQLDISLGEGSVVLLVRDPLAAHALAEETHLAVRTVRRASDLGVALGQRSLALVMYPNQAVGNFAAIGFPRPAHVHLSHGESEKVSMVSNKLKAYDKVFVAGDAARERIAKALVPPLPHSEFAIGRPQADEPSMVPSSFLAFDGVTVLYSPTWEGESAEMSYSSVASAGLEIVKGIDSLGYRVLYRPHPQLGTLSGVARAADASIQAWLESRPLPHVIDTGIDFGWQLRSADVVVSDMSAVAFDSLAWGTPLTLVHPGSDAWIAPDSLFDKVPVVHSNGVDAASVILKLLREDPEITLRQQELARSYFGQTAPGEQIRRYLEACTKTMAERQQYWLELGWLAQNQQD